MTRQNRRKSPAESKISNLVQQNSFTKMAYVEHESNPWFDIKSTEAEHTQIDNYINNRFKEFEDAELLVFLKGNMKFRNIVSDIRNVYIKTDDSNRRKRAA